MAQPFNQGGVCPIHLTMAINPVDHVRDVMDGTVQVQGATLTTLALPPEEIFYRFTSFQEWDVSEMSFAKFVSLTGSGDAPMVGLPIFTSRMFRHSSIYLSSGSAIVSPKDLEGRTVGIPEWAQTAGVWVRGLLAHQYDVDLRNIRWVQSGVNEFGRREKVALNLPAGIDYTAHPDRSLNDLLTAGEVDAVISARPPIGFAEGKAQRLFSDFRATEADYFRKTSIFPIMHVAVLKRSTFDTYPWIAQNLMKAFDEARRRSIARAMDITASPLPLAWATAFASEVDAIFQGDPWPYGMDANRTTIDTFLRYAVEQGILSNVITAPDLFPRETLSSVRV